jgi:hypothetical protein
MKLSHHLLHAFFLTGITSQLLVAQSDLVINQDAINASYVHYNGSILIEPIFNDISISGLFIFDKDLVLARSITVKPLSNNSITIVPSTISSKTGVYASTRLAGCGEDHQIPPLQPNYYKSQQENQPFILSYEVYDLNGVLIKQDTQHMVPYDKYLLELPKNQIYIIKINYLDGRKVIEKHINQ